MSKLILGEHFAHILLARGRDWVLRHCPETLANVVCLMENYLAAEVALAESYQRPPEATGVPLFKGEPSWGNLQTDGPVLGTEVPILRGHSGPQGPGLAPCGKPCHSGPQPRQRLLGLPQSLLQENKGVGADKSQRKGSP